MKALLPVITIALFCSNLAFAQSNDLDKKYRPKEGSSKELSAENNVAGVSRKSNIKNALYLEPFLVARGQLAATYERELSPKGISLTGTLGYNLFEDFISTSTLKEEMLLGNTTSENSDFVGYSDYFRIAGYENGNLFFQTSLRFFIREYFGDLDGNGLELIYRRTVQNFRYPSERMGDLYSYYSFPSPRTDAVTFSSFVIAFRSQVIGSGKKPFIHGVSYGLGYRQVKYPSYEYVESQDPFGINQYAIQRDGNRYQTAQGITVMFNYSLGFGW